MLPGDKVGNGLESEISYMGLLPDVPGTLYFFYVCKPPSFFSSYIFLRLLWEHQFLMHINAQEKYGQEGGEQWQWLTPVTRNILSMTFFELMVHGDNRKQTDFWSVSFLCKSIYSQCIHYDLHQEHTDHTVLPLVYCWKKNFLFVWGLYSLIYTKMLMFVLVITVDVKLLKSVLKQKVVSLFINQILL